MTGPGGWWDVGSVSCDFPTILLWFLTIEMQLSLVERLILVSVLIQPAIFHETCRNVISLRPSSLSNLVAIGQAAETDRYTYSKTLISLLSFLKKCLWCPFGILVWETKDVVVKNSFCSFPRIPFNHQKDLLSLQVAKYKRRNSLAERKHTVGKKQKLGVSEQWNTICKKFNEVTKSHGGYMQGVGIMT